MLNATTPSNNAMIVESQTTCLLAFAAVALLLAGVLAALVATATAIALRSGVSNLRMLRHHREKRMFILPAAAARAAWLRCCDCSYLVSLAYDELL